MLAIVGVGVAVHAVVMARYGFHRDEFYYINTGRHLAWGYDDQPPVTPVLARLAAALPGSDLLALRALAILCGAALVVLVVLIARELGAGRRAQIIAAGVAAASPVIVGPTMFFGTTVTDDVAWCAVFLLVLWALRTGRTGAWVAAGVAAGMGLENKRTVAVLLVGIFAGLLVTRREVLRTAGPWIAAAIALVILAPNLVWDAANGWPTFAFTQRLAEKIGGPLGEVGQLAQLPVLLGPPLLVVLYLGARWLWKDPEARPHRWILICALVVVALFAVGLGKVYYPAPAAYPLYAAGAIAIDQRRWRTAGTAVFLGITWLFTMFVTLPFAPVSVATKVPGLKDVSIESYGWPEFTEQVAAVVNSLPAADRNRLVLFTSNYGEAGALARFGPARGLTAPVRSGQNAYGDWGPELSGTPATVVCAGEFGPDYLHHGWNDIQRVATFHLPHDVQNEEIRSGAAIYLCRSPRGSWAQIWPRLMHFDGHLRHPGG